MKKIINITGQDMIDMGWNLIGEDKPSDNFILEINTAPEKRTIRIAPDVDGADWLSDNSFDYEETLQDLDDNNHLPCGIFQGNSVFYNDHENETSQSIQHGEISEIIGNMSSIELKVYSSLHELNQEIDGFSFSFEPEYELS